MIPLGKRIAKKRRMVNRERLPPSRRKTADEIFEIMVYGRKRRKRKRISRITPLCNKLHSLKWF